MNACLTEYFRCPEECAPFAWGGEPSLGCGYFRFGKDATCFGNCSGHSPAQDCYGGLHDALSDVKTSDGKIVLPFDPSEVVLNLHRELYIREWRSGLLSTLAKAYYLIRPLLSVGVRKYLQKLHLRDWDKLPFPRWPVDTSVDDLLEELILLALSKQGVERIPFIWFWPEGKSACAMMTHDVETEEGRKYCPTLMDLDESFGIRASFQVIPEQRYSVAPEFLQSIRDRGFEVVIHDLNHDGHLYESREQFVERAARINSYGRDFHSDGFRAAVLYRKQVWYDALKFSFDMSVPNVAHLDPQRGGCCTVKPYFIGDILELPVTMIQDYTLFHILNDYSIEIWKKQSSLILAKHGLMSFIVHPDYVMKSREQGVYRSLLKHIVQMGQEENVWISTPGQVNRWWRLRSRMKLAEADNSWRIEGEGNERARIAWAHVVDGRVVFSLGGQADTVGAMHAGVSGPDVSRVNPQLA